MRDLILPEVEKIAKQLQIKGHGTELQASFEHVLNPSIKLEFTPKHPRYIPASKILHDGRDNGYLDVSCEIRTVHGEARGLGSLHEKLDYSSVNREWARETTLKFIKSALGAN